jgi:hypothetical protein
MLDVIPAIINDIETGETPATRTIIWKVIQLCAHRSGVPLPAGSHYRSKWIRNPEEREAYFTRALAAAK